jgi:hypothetical protein
MKVRKDRNALKRIDGRERGGMRKRSNKSKDRNPLKFKKKFPATQWQVITHRFDPC